MRATSEQPSAYIPRDRRQALLDGTPLPSRLTGCALFADISGFTPLTEALANELGPQRGVEQLTIYLNEVFDALIFALHDYGGAVIGFSGDAITCWFSNDDGHRAAASALAMQTAMQRFEAVSLPSGRTLPLAIKVAIAAGSVQRFVVGTADHRLIDVAAGTTLENLAAAEHQAQTREIIVDNSVLEQIGHELFLSEIRTDQGRRFGVLTGLRDAVPTQPWSEASANALDLEAATPWLLPPVAKQLDAGNGEFLAELRPAIALFIRFTGIAYDDDPDASEKLNSFIVAVQKQLNRYGGSLIQLTLGDKGSYLYAAFGAPIAHKDDAARAATVALNVRDLANELPYIDAIQLGITRGRMRTGAYGGRHRRTYGVLGDMVNLSARLMTHATAGEILITATVEQELGPAFEVTSLSPIKVKGKTDPIVIARLDSKAKVNPALLQTDDLSMPLLGRNSELSQLQTYLMKASRGNGQIVAVTGDAGIGKSVLVSSFLRQLPAGIFKLLSGKAEAWGQKDSYLIWQDVWRNLFELSPDQPYEVQLAQLDMMLSAMDPALLSRLPLLGSVVNLSIPDNRLTRTFDAKLRRTALESLLVSVLAAATQKRAMVIVLEDVQWIDSLSADLLQTIATAIHSLPILLICVERIDGSEAAQSNKLQQHDHFTQVAITPLSKEHVRDFILHKARAMGCGRLEPATLSSLTDFIAERTSGNPFFIEEIFNYLGAKEIDVSDVNAVTNVDLPATVHSLMLSRIDQLAASQQSTLKVASVIGRMFRAMMVQAIMPTNTDESKLMVDLDHLVLNELTLVDNGAGELSYLFRNLVTQEVAYNNLPYAMRARLHERIGHQIEAEFPDSLTLYLDLLAYHYGFSENKTKKRHYLLAAADKAEHEYSNQAALAYLQQALPLVEDEDHFGVLRRIGKLHELHANWDDAHEYYGHAQTVAKKYNATADFAWAQLDQADLHRKRGEYPEATTLLEEVRATFTDLDDQEGMGQTLHIMGTLSAQSGNLEQAGKLYRESLVIREALGDKKNIGALLSNLGIVARYSGNYDEARALYEQSLIPRREQGDKWAIGVSLSNLGNVALDQKDFATAKSSLEQGLQMVREVGDRQFIALNLNNLANVQRDMEDYGGAKRSFAEGLRLNRMLNDKWGLVYLLEDISIMQARNGNSEQALKMVGAANQLRTNINTPRSEAEQTKLDTGIAHATGAISKAMQSHLLEQGAATELGELVSDILEQFETV